MIAFPLELPWAQTGPIDQVSIDDVSLFIDENGDTWALIDLVAPWVGGPPPNDAAFSMFIGVRVDVGGGTESSASCSLHDGVTESDLFEVRLAPEIGDLAPIALGVFRDGLRCWRPP